jgi:hypothetical protein
MPQPQPPPPPPPALWSWSLTVRMRTAAGPEPALTLASGSPSCRCRRSSRSCRACARARAAVRSRRSRGSCAPTANCAQPTAPAPAPAGCSPRIADPFDPLELQLWCSLSACTPHACSHFSPPPQAQGRLARRRLPHRCSSLPASAHCTSAVACCPWSLLGSACSSGRCTAAPARPVVHSSARRQGLYLAAMFSSNVQCFWVQLANRRSAPSPSSRRKVQGAQARREGRRAGRWSRPCASATIASAAPAPGGGGRICDRRCLWRAAALLLPTKQSPLPPPPPAVWTFVRVVVQAHVVQAGAAPPAPRARRPLQQSLALRQLHGCCVLCPRPPSRAGGTARASGSAACHDRDQRRLQAGTGWHCRAGGGEQHARRRSPHTRPSPRPGSSPPPRPGATRPARRMAAARVPR